MLVMMMKISQQRRTPSTRTRTRTRTQAKKDKDNECTHINRNARRKNNTTSMDQLIKKQLREEEEEDDDDEDDDEEEEEEDQKKMMREKKRNSLTRRRITLLATSAGAAGVSMSPVSTMTSMLTGNRSEYTTEALASPLDALLERKRKSNASYFLGPVRVMKSRLRALLDTLQTGVDDETLRLAALDCVPDASGRTGSAVSSVRVDNCTLDILVKNVAARTREFAKGDRSPERATLLQEDAGRIRDDIVDRFGAIHMALDRSSGGDGGASNAGDTRAAIEAVLGRVDAFERVLQEAFGIESCDDDAAYRPSDVYDCAS